MSSTLMQGHWDYSNNPVVGYGYITSGGVVLAVQLMLFRTFLPNTGTLIRDGYYGPATEAAVKSFQQAEGITVDGVVGPQTWYRFWQKLIVQNDYGTYRLWVWKYNQNQDPSLDLHFMERTAEGDFWCVECQCVSGQTGDGWSGGNYVVMDNTHYSDPYAGSKNCSAAF
ncbi:peptidoglycan-binding domain-containing protein [Alicyclobacillus macrosporangiidus]|uniref:Putative peptidoglycan binding domain-containing protein n=1 Tax=Alicyclobacillus macrosporangiidus TaxID=392015 RepID=A0A1I7FX63_9BACL|nr:peptidoglycan-binding domain-containing protein [Alicyclobacillus macrosporangiidus]SFU40789.1 Putative peptidoglycan binding domain-containing protein [Alicyclobacillus macrosporangiidus]